jgi:hypothetical protein
MILEGIVTSLDAAGAVNIAPMGPRLFPPFELRVGSRFELKPYQTARTWANLKAHPEGVLHVHDDVLLLAQAAVGADYPTPPLEPASVVRGRVLADACRAYEFRVAECDDSQPRIKLVAEVVHARTMRDFFGFNRAMNAVLEAAILATRTDFLPLAEIEAEFRRLAVIIDKTAGPRQREAFAFLQSHLEAVKARRP